MVRHCGLFATPLGNQPPPTIERRATVVLLRHSQNFAPPARGAATVIRKLFGPVSIVMRPIRNWNGRGLPPAPLRSAVARRGGGVVGTKRGRIFMLQAPIHGQEREKDGDDNPNNRAARHRELALAIK
jgi:hypothetical protein